MPYVCKTFFGFQLGDTLNILFENKQETFIIAGFTEDVLFGSRSYIAFDLPERQFYSFREKAGAAARAAIVLVRAEGKAGEVSNQFSELIADKEMNWTFIPIQIWNTPRTAGAIIFVFMSRL